MTTAATVLLVDDEPKVLSALERTLRGDGHRLLAAAGPREALAILGKEPVDVIISDVDMPGMSGVELVARARRDFPHVVRMLLSGRGTMQEALTAINEGRIFRYLTKPWDDDELRRTVSEASSRLRELRREEQAERAAAREGEAYVPTHAIDSERARAALAALAATLVTP